MKLINVILPLLCFFSIFIFLRKSHVVDSWRSSFLLASLYLGFLITLMTELLSAFKSINVWTISAAWLLGFALVLFWFKGSSNPGRLNGRTRNPIDLSRFELLLLAGISLVVLVIGVIAWTAPPNNYDSMTYHMSRVIHWMQNGSISFYPTHIPRQLYQNPGSEYAILNLQILSAGDRLANFIQWFSMVGSIAGVSLIAKELGAEKRGQIFAAVVCATIPMGVLQGSSTQNDYVVALWLVCFIYSAMMFANTHRLIYAIAFGVGLGLAILTKATAYLYAFPFLIWLGLSSLQRPRARKIQLVALSLAMVVLLSLGHYARNYNLSGSPLGPGRESAAGYVYANDTFTPAAISSNALRNLGLHIGTPSSTVNYYLEAVIYKLHKLIGISLNDARTTWTGTEFHVTKPSFHEDLAGNPIHLVLIAAALLLFALRRRWNRRTTAYVVSLLSAALLFSLYLKWQPWHSRLHLPLFVLFSPFVGLILSREKTRWLANAVVVFLLVSALPWLLGNTSRPILSVSGEKRIFARSRVEQYFANGPQFVAPYNGAAEIIADIKCSDIGLLIDGNDLEYPLWGVLHERQKGLIRLEHVAVTNASQKYYQNYLATFTPCAIFAVNPSPPSTLSIRDLSYDLKWSSNSVNVYVPTRKPEL